MTTETSAQANAPEPAESSPQPSTEAAVSSPDVAPPLSPALVAAALAAKPALAAVPRAMPILRTRKQIAAAASVEQAETRARWKQAVPVASTLWPKLDPAQLAGIHGNLNKLAGMIQMRYQTTREVADAQVAAFVAKTTI